MSILSPNGLKLLNIDPAALVNTSLAKLFALPNLSHFVNAIALVIDNEVATIINKRYKTAILKLLKLPTLPKLLVVHIIKAKTL